MHGYVVVQESCFQDLNDFENSKHVKCYFTEMEISHQDWKIRNSSEIWTRTVLCKMSYCLLVAGKKQLLFFFFFWVRGKKVCKSYYLVGWFIVKDCYSCCMSALQIYEILCNDGTKGVLCKGIPTKQSLIVLKFCSSINRKKEKNVVLVSTMLCAVSCSVTAAQVEIWVNSVQQSVWCCNEDGRSLRWRPFKQEHRQTHMPTAQAGFVNISAHRTVKVNRV